LDFSDDALQGSEKAFKRLWEAYENLKKISFSRTASATNVSLNEKITTWLRDMEDFMDDDFSTPKIIANMFEIAPTINSIKDGLIDVKEIGDETLALMKERFETFLEKIFGLTSLSETNNDKLGDVLELLLEIRREAKQKKDFATSDNIRNKLNEKGIIIKDDKEGNTSWSIA
jgi:cysteinyl-tRNA synthetase